MFLRRTTESLEFTSVHGGATLVSVTGGIGSARTGKKFFVELIKSINAAKAARPQAAAAVPARRDARASSAARAGRADASSSTKRARRGSWRRTEWRPATSARNFSHVDHRLHRQMIRRTPRQLACDALRSTRSPPPAAPRCASAPETARTTETPPAPAARPRMRCASRSVAERGNHSFMSPSTIVGSSAAPSATATSKLTPLHPALGATQPEMRRDDAQRVTAEIELARRARRAARTTNSSDRDDAR